MANRPLGHRLARGICACAAVGLLLAGCTTANSSSGTSVKGSTLSIYVSAPPGPVSPETQDIVSAEQLAFNQAGRKVGKFQLKLVRFPGRKLSNSARQAVGDATTIAYLGEVAPGDSADTIGITNALQVLQVSPTDTAVELTHSTPAIANTPNPYYEALGTYGRTFARLVPTDALEAQAVIAQMQALGVKRVYVPSDGSEYGRALRSAFLSRAGTSLTVASSATGADAIFYAGSSAAGATSAFDQAASGNSKVALFAPSALAESSFAASLSPAAQRDLFVSSPGFLSSGLPALGRQFDSAFRAAYGHAPATQAVFGYAAMSAVIHALQKAGSSAGSRSTVVHDFFAITNLSTAVGTVSVTKDGDVTFVGGAPFVFSRVKAGKLTAAKAVQEQG